MSHLLRVALLFLALQTHSVSAADGEGLVTFPDKIDPACRRGSAKIYDECGDQHALFNAALAEARRQDKVLLVSYGAEWCIWCHVFHDFVTGVSGEFTHTFSDPDDKSRDTATIYERAKRDVSGEAAELAAFAAENFVLVHLDTRYAPGADDALESTGLDWSRVRGLPYVFTVTPDGRFAADLNPDRVETRRDGLWDWFRGYDRPELMQALAEMRDVARQ